MITDTSTATSTPNTQSIAMCFLLHNGKMEEKNTKIKIARQKYGDDMHDTTSG